MKKPRPDNLVVADGVRNEHLRLGRGFLVGRFDFCCLGDFALYSKCFDPLIVHHRFTFRHLGSPPLRALGFSDKQGFYR